MTTRMKYPAPAADVIASDLIVEITPREGVEWIGTQAQLRAEGLVPDQVHWPDRDRWVGWQASGFEYWLRRTRPPGTRGPKRAWLETDWWALRRTLLADRGKGHWPAAIHEKRQELETLLWKQSEEGQRFSQRWLRARDDGAFQSFKRRVIFG
ncbi:MAG: hypothetical protein IT531_03290 [Burkholderiales bacterium]|nr:hypothetical protein [Burkholderiales bacterium]